MRDPAAFAKTMAESFRTTDIYQTRRQRQREQQHFERVRNAQAVYQAQLRRVARLVGEIIQNYPPGDPAALAELQSLLDQYASVLRPWAYAAAARMIAEVTRRDETAWMRHAKDIGIQLRRDLLGPGAVAEDIRRLIEDQVELITSIPTQAGREVQAKSREYWAGGIRYNELRDYIAQRPDVTYNRATLIARTETAKTASAVTQARAQYIGSTHYIWRSVRDKDVRRMHKILNGTVQAWDDPPVAEEQGQRHHPGEFPNCFPGSAKVDLRCGVKRLWRAFYTGPLVRLVIGSSIVEATPNHPILTTNGWLAISAVNRGDEVLALPRESGGIGDDGKDYHKVAFDQLFEAAWIAGGSRMRHVGGDFHGDVFDNDVDEITVNQNLLSDWKTGGFECGCQFALTNANRRIWQRSVVGGADHVIVTDSAGRSDPGNVLFWRFERGDQLIGLKPAAYGDAVMDQQFPDSLRDYAVLSCERRRAVSCLVSGNDVFCRQIEPGRAAAFADSRVNTALPQINAENIGIAANGLGSVTERAAVAHQRCRVIDKAFRQFSGHVFTLESERGNYSVGGDVMILAKNCRCYAEPILPEVIE